MNDATIDLIEADNVDAGVLVFEVSDEALEAVATPEGVKLATGLASYIAHFHCC